MWSLISEKDKREYHIIQLLFHSNEPLTSHYLAKMTDSSVRSVKNYLNGIRDFIKEMNGSLVSSSEGFVLNLPPNISLDFFQHRLYKNSLAFKFLEEVFFNDSLNSAEMEKRLFVGASTLNRLVSDIRDVLKDYNFTLMSNPFRIKGEEFLVRNFFNMYFSEAYHFKDWPFKRISRKAVAAIIPHVIDFYKLDVNSVNFHQLCVLLAVDITRELNGYIATGNPINKDSIIPKQECSEFNTRIQDLIEPFRLPQDEMAIYINQIKNWESYFSISYLKKQMEADSQIKQIADDIQQVLIELSELFYIPQNDHTTLIFELVTLLNTYQKFSTNSNAQLHILFKPRDYFLIDIYKQQYPLFHTIASKRLTTICHNYKLNLDKNTFLDLMYILLTKWEDLTRSLFYNFTSCKVLLFSHISQRNAENIKNEMLSQINRAVEISIYEGQSISEESLADYDFDLLLTTTTLSLDIEQPIHYVHRPHLTLELDGINQAIDEQAEINKEKIYATKLKKAKTIADRLKNQ